jgi:hypothetical protein
MHSASDAQQIGVSWFSTWAAVVLGVMRVLAFLWRRFKCFPLPFFLSKCDSDKDDNFIPRLESDICSAVYKVPSPNFLVSPTSDGVI